MTAAWGDEPRESAAHPAARRSAPAQGRRGDIQGLRAIAVLLVLAYHAGVPWFPAGFIGVDVFFVISGFLITGLLVKELECSGTISLRAFYARRARRLLPAAGTVLLFVAVTTVLVLPETRWRSIVWDVVTSAFYVVNWRLADKSVDYLAQDEAASPVQHFWSLAVEEQFYVIWPLLFLGAVAVRRRFRTSLRLALGAGLALVALPSFAWSIYLTPVSPGPAYFVTTTRLWELAIGAALALSAASFMHLPAMVVRLLGWGGLAAIAVFAIAVPANAPFPGAAAAIPTIGSAAVLAAGIATPEAGVGRALSWRPLQGLGSLSYSLYLWHWPIIVAGVALWGSDGSISWTIGSVLAAASILPAWLTFRYIEAPIHKAPLLTRRPGLVVQVLAVSTLVPVLAVGGIYVSTTRDTGGPAAPAAGAEAVEDQLEEQVPSIDELPDDLDNVIPSPIEAVDDNADVYAQGCHQDEQQSEAINCVFGPEDGEVKVALVGDSHAAQWQPALQELAAEHRFTLVTSSKSACGLFAVDVAIGDPLKPYESCSEWNDNVMAWLTGPDGPDVVVTTSSNDYAIHTPTGIVSGEGAAPLLVQGYEMQWKHLVDHGIDVVAIANTPWVGVEVPECVVENESALHDCVVPSEEAVGRAGTHQAEAAERVEGVHLIDLNRWICPSESCPPIIGDVIVWRDSHHLTATYARSLAPVLEKQLADVGVLPDPSP